MTDLETILDSEELRERYLSIVEGGTVSYPIYVEIHPTNRCNSNCYFCNQAECRKEVDEEVGWECLKNSIYSLSEKGLRVVRLSGGGDPTVYNKIREILDLFRKKKIEISRFDTNGLNLSDNLIKALIDCNLKTLHVSLQAPTPESWSKITGLNAKKFEKILNQINKYIELNDTGKAYKVCLSFIVDKTTVDLISEMLSIKNLFGVDIDVHDLNNYCYSEDFYRKSMPILMDRLNKLKKEELDCFSFNVLKNPKRYIKERCEGAGRMKKARMICLGPWTSMLIKGNGHVFPCCNLQLIHSKIMGDIRKSDFINIWLGEKYSLFRSEVKKIFVNSESEEGDNNRSELKTVCNERCQVMNGMLGYEMSELICNH